MLTAVRQLLKRSTDAETAFKQTNMQRTHKSASCSYISVGFVLQQRVSE